MFVFTANSVDSGLHRNVGLEDLVDLRDLPPELAQATARHWTSNCSCLCPCGRPSSHGETHLLFAARHFRQHFKECLCSRWAETCWRIRWEAGIGIVVMSLCCHFIHMVLNLKQNSKIFKGSERSIPQQNISSVFVHPFHSNCNFERVVSWSNLFRELQVHSGVQACDMACDHWSWIITNRCSTLFWHETCLPAFVSFTLLFWRSTSATYLWTIFAEFCFPGLDGGSAFEAGSLSKAESSTVRWVAVQKKGNQLALPACVTTCTLLVVHWTFLTNTDCLWLRFMSVCDSWSRPRPIPCLKALQARVMTQSTADSFGRHAFDDKKSSCQLRTSDIAVLGCACCTSINSSDVQVSHACLWSAWRGLDQSG